MKLVKSLIAGAALFSASQAMAATFSLGGVTWDEDASNPLSSSFSFFQWYTGDINNPLTAKTQVPSSPDDIGTELFAVGEFDSFSDGRENWTNNFADKFFISEPEQLTFTLTGVVFDPANSPTPGASQGLDWSNAFVDIYVDTSGDFNVSDLTDWEDAGDFGDPDVSLWARFSFDSFILNGDNLLDAQLIAGLDFDSSDFADDAADLLDKNDLGPDFFLNSSAQFTVDGQTVARSNGQLVRAVPVPAPLALLGLGLIALGLRSRKV